MQIGSYRGARALIRALDAVGVPATADTEGDHTMVIVDPMARRPYTLIPVWAGEGALRDVERGLAQLAATSLVPGQTPVLVIRSASRTSQSRLREAGLSWADEAGRAQVTAPPGLFVARDVRARAFTEASGRFRWSPSAGAVAETLLAGTARTQDPPAGQAAPLRTPPHQTIAEISLVSAPQVSKVLGRFDAQGWTVKRGSQRGPGAERLLVDPAGLLGDWAEWHRHRKRSGVRIHATFPDARSFVAERLGPVLPPGAWCVTDWLAADILAPLMTSRSTIACYVTPSVLDAGLEPRLAAAGLRQLDQGTEVTLVEAEPHVLAMAGTGSLPLASAVRVYADLLSAGAPGEDAAQHLRDVTLGY